MSGAPSSAPLRKELKSAYGYYLSKSWYNKEECAVYTVTTLVLKSHKVLAADYAGVKTFFDEVIQDDAQRLVVNMTGSASPEKKGF